MRNLIRYPDGSSRRVHIEDSLLPHFHNALSKLSWNTTRDYLLFVLLTGLRKAEAMKLLWSDVDLPAGIIQIRAEDCMNRHGYTLPLSKFLISFLQERKTLSGESLYVFPGKSGYGHLRSCQRVIRDMRKLLGQEIQVKDLRSTKKVSSCQL